MGMKVLNLGILSSRVSEIQEFTFTITTTSSPQNFTLPLVAVGGHTHDFVVDWGDETSSTITSWDDPDKVHEYATAGNYTVKIAGECPSFYFNNGGDKLLITSVVSWGVDVDLRKLSFYGCSNLISLPNEAGKLSLPTDFFYSFFNCTSLTAIPEGLFDDNIAVTNFYGCFRNCT